MSEKSAERSRGLINSLVLDADALLHRVEKVLEELNKSEQAEDLTRVNELKVFNARLTEAMLRLKQKGIHPTEQGSLW